jgi:hypothetical protein
VSVALAADTGATSVGVQALPPWQSLSFESSGLQVLSGNLELLLATWTAHCQNLQARTMPGGPIRGVAIQRQLSLNASNGHVYSRILAFGPGWPGAPANIDSGMFEGMDADLLPCRLDNPGMPADLPHGVPDRFTWWGRLAVPIAWPEGSNSPQHFAEQVRSAADRFRWTLETQLGSGEWEPHFAERAVLERSFQNSWQTLEDWYFNPQNFSLHARVLALHWQDAEGRRFRYRLREG